jgi:hypothetical protein
MNNVFTFVLLLVAIVSCAKIIQSYLERRQEKRAPDEEVEATLARIDALEERIRVLERILTENRYDLKREIDSL